MKRLATLLLVCACLLAPNTARADDGGWLDWLFRLDAKFIGYATDFHPLCISREHKVMRCEELYTIPRRVAGVWRESIPYADIQHEFNVRVGFYHLYGHVVDKVSTSAHAWKLMGFYAYHPDQHMTISLGAGAVPISGRDVQETHWSTIYTPLSVRWSPAGSRSINRESQRKIGSGLVAGFFVQGEASFFTDPPTPETFGLTPRTRSEKKGEWNAALLIGFDFRR